jgi:hypothetical protein
MCCIQRVVVRLDSGRSPYPVVDPLIVGDINGNGRLDAGDALLIQRKVVHLPVPELPDLPSPLPAIPLVARSAGLEITPFNPIATGSPRQVDLRTTDLATLSGHESTQTSLDAARLVLEPVVQPKSNTNDSGGPVEAASTTNSANTASSATTPYVRSLRPAARGRGKGDCASARHRLDRAHASRWFLPTLGMRESSPWKTSS